LPQNLFDFTSNRTEVELWRKAYFSSQKRTFCFENICIFNKTQVFFANNGLFYLLHDENALSHFTHTRFSHSQLVYIYLHLIFLWFWWSIPPLYRKYIFPAFCSVYKLLLQLIRLPNSILPISFGTWILQLERGSLACY
jgi:hypothetical protein